MTTSEGWTEVGMSTTAQRTENPIRGLLGAGVKAQSTPRSTKRVLNMSMGDPTVYGNLKTPTGVLDAVHNALNSYKGHGYGPAAGLQVARQALADKYSNPEHGVKYEASDVFLASGGSGAIELAMIALCSAGDSILLPCPGFTLYKTQAISRGIIPKEYNLLPEKNWECDLAQMEALIDSTTKAILINNPSNPCGSNWSKEHILAILAIADRHKVPIISDEIYESLVFTGQIFYSTASLSKTVPIITMGGLAKRYVAPGWRIGWNMVHDPLHVMGSIKIALNNLCAILNGPNTTVQLAMPEIFFGDFNDAHLESLKATLEENAKLVEKRANAIKGLRAISPQGAMYIMILFDPEIFDDALKNDSELFHNLLWEENVEILPGDIFGLKNSMRIVVAPPKDILDEAFDRIEAFCNRHYKV